MYEYVCPSGHTTEKIRGVGESSSPCFCGQASYRLSVYHVNIGQREQKYRVSDVVEASSEIDYAYTSAEQANGVTLKRPSPFKAGVAEAKKRGAKVRVHA